MGGWVGGWVGLMDEGMWLRRNGPTIFGKKEDKLGAFCLACGVDSRTHVI